MKTLSLEQMEKVEGGKFIGNTYDCVQGSSAGTCTKKFHLFWFTVHKDIYTVSDCNLYCGPN